MSYYSKYIKNFFSSSSVIAPDRFINLYSKRIILPTYHLVSEITPAHITSLYKPKTKKEFIKDLDFILKHFKPIDLNELIRIQHNNINVKENLFHLSFDDGLRECEEIISPILKEKGIPATFFINPYFVDNKDLMFRYKASLLINALILQNSKNQKLISTIKNIAYPERSQLDELAISIGIDYSNYLKTQKPYMNEYQIQKLINDGFTVGAHSLDHPKYSHISFEEQIRQTKKSIDYTTKTFNVNYKVFAFPFNDDFISKHFFDSTLNPPDKTADLVFGVAGIKKDYHPHHLQRIPMEGMFAGNKIIKGEYLYHFIKALIGKNTIKRL
jgi:peptidoglycan/xylan/chitin deacetylase (PgdA/CDA1 family)